MSNAYLFTRKSYTVVGVEWTGDNHDEIADFIDGKTRWETTSPGGQFGEVLIVEEFAGLDIIAVRPGEWLIQKGDKFSKYDADTLTAGYIRKHLA